MSLNMQTKKNTMLTDVDFGSLSYDEDGLATIEATLVFDYAILVY